jgi:hypothetical protein
MLELDEEVIRMTDTAERPAYRPGLRPGMPGFPAPKDRPVPLQRREPVPRESFTADPPETNGETRTGETGIEEVPVPPSAAPLPAAAAPQGTDVSDAATDTGDTPRSPRRRRGRRGGRRGRGRTDSGSVSPNVIGADGTPTPSSTDAADDGDDGEGDGEGDDS